MKELEKVIEQVIDENTSLVLEFKKGEYKALEKLVTQTLKKLGGKGDPKRIKEILLSKIG